MVIILRQSRCLRHLHALFASRCSTKNGVVMCIILSIVFHAAAIAGFIYIGCDWDGKKERQRSWYINALYIILLVEYVLLRLLDFDLSCWGTTWRDMLKKVHPIKEIVEEHADFVYIVLGEQLISIVNLMSSDITSFPDAKKFVVGVAILQALIAFAFSAAYFQCVKQGVYTMDKGIRGCGMLWLFFHAALPAALLTISTGFNMMLHVFTTDDSARAGNPSLATFSIGMAVSLAALLCIRLTIFFGED